MHFYCGHSGRSLLSLGQDAMQSIVILRSPSGKWEDGFVQCSVSTSHEKMLYGFCILRKINIQYASEGREAYFFSDRSILVLNAKKASTEITN